MDRTRSVRAVPRSRIEVMVDIPIAERGYVLYWMVGARRPYFNFGLQHAVEEACRLGRPLVVFEPLRSDFPHACARFHTFVHEGMLANAEAFAGRVTYLPYIGPGKGVLAHLAKDACLVVTDAAPGFFVPRAQAAAALPVRTERVDSVGILPLSVSTRPLPAAVHFRRLLQRTGVTQAPLPDPLEGVTLAQVDVRLERGSPRVDGPAPVAIKGGWKAARARWRSFDVEAYGFDQPSGLSPWLHFGHLSPHEVLADLLPAGWASHGPATGKREGWWGLSPTTETFLDELVVWRELGQHAHHLQPDLDRYETLPEWARRTLANHAGDPRHIYPFVTLEAGETGDPIWNAAQHQLTRDGHIHNRLRMYWGKKVIEWTSSPEKAWETLVTLNDRWALDGRDPNSYSGIGWCFGRYDRPWPPDKPILGVVRSMSGRRLAEKFDLGPYLARYA